MTPERLAEIEALASNTRPPQWGTVPDLCTALREAWAEIVRVKGLAIRLGDGVDQVLLSNASGIFVRADLSLLNGASLTTDEWRSLGENSR